MFTEVKITDIFCLADDFANFFSRIEKHQLEDGKRHRNKPSMLT